jgi:hypothetical protein
VKSSVRFKDHPPPKEKRRIVQSSLGCHVQGAAMPHPCPDDRNTMLAGVIKRFAKKPPAPDGDLMREFGDFVDKFLKEHLVPLDADSDVSVETWLSKTKYPMARREELQKLHNEFPVCEPRFHKVKGFMKDETYPEYKNARGINSRHDRFKTEVGPVFKLIEEQVYKLHWFIKHVPVADRPRVIKERLFALGRLYYATDYTAFESLFTKWLMQTCEFKLYNYMTQKLPCHEKFMHLVNEVLGGLNHIVYKFFGIDIEATRMSGEMCTSLGNGFTNLMVALFVAFKSECIIDGFVEGDDGLFALLSGKGLDESLFKRLGLDIKLEKHTDLCSASFCGIIFDPDDCINVTDPREVLAGFGWTTNLYFKAGESRRLDLLRAKSLSYAHQYPGCPIIAELAQYGLRMTRSRDVRHFVAERWQTSQWEREQLLSVINDRVPKKEVGMSTRLLVERKYGIPIEIQIKIENYLRSLDELRPLDISCFDLMVPRSWTDYFSRYLSLGLEQNPPCARVEKLPFPNVKV